MTIDVQMPDFSKFKPDFEGEEDFEKAREKERDGAGKFFRPGEYELEVKEVTLQAPRDSDKDPTWRTLVYVLGGSDDKTIKYFLRFPTVREKYGDNKSSLPLHIFLEFCRAMGMRGVQAGKTGNVLAEYFSDLEHHIGKRLTVIVDYDAFHTKYSKDSAGNAIYTLMSPKGEPVMENGKAKVFPSDEAAKADCLSNNRRFNGFCQIKKVMPPAVENVWGKKKKPF